LGPAVGIVAALLGMPLMAWQQYVADVILEIDPETGELVFDEWVLTVPRQSGKSVLILAKASHRCSATGFFGPDQQIAYVAQTKLKATEKFERDYARAIKHGAARLKARTRTGNQKVDIRYPNGSIFGVEAVTEKSGHGSTLDEAYVDEAFAQPDNRMEQAFEPAMVTRRNKQLGVVSTAGWLGVSLYLWGKVEVGRRLVREGVRRGMAFFEWSAPEDADPADENVWLACMPALHRPDCLPSCKAHTVQLKTIRSLWDKARRSGKIADFCRAYLNQWKPKPREGEQTALGNWAACRLPEVPGEPPLGAVGVAVSVDREWASVGAVGVLDDGRHLLTAVERREGTDWLKAHLLGVQSRRPDTVFVMAAKGPGSDLVEPFREAGLNVVTASFDEYVTACAAVSDGVQYRTVAHLDHPDLNESVAGARWRFVNDRRVLARRGSESDVSMLEAVTLALWGANQGSDPLDNIW